MKIPLPRSLSGQLALVMAGALLIASVVNFVLLIGERQRSQLIEQSVPAIARFADVAQEIFKSPPPTDRPLGIGRPQGPGRYVLQATNAVDNRDLARDGELERRLTTALIDGGVTVSEVRASARSIVRPERPGPGPDPGDPRIMFQRPGAGPGLDQGARPPPNFDPPPGMAPMGPMRAPPPGDQMRPAREAREVILSAQLPDGRWLTSFSISPESTSGDMFLLGASTFVIFAFVLAAALWIASRLARPLRDLTAAAQQVGAAGEPQEVKVQGPGDVRQTLEAFNAMSRRVSQLLGEKDVMLGALGHDLRTPLASLRIRIESMEPEAERQKAARTIEEASKLLEDILELARQGKSKEPVQAMDVSILVEDMVEDYAETGSPVSLAASEKSPAACRPVLLRRALRNLIDNAVIYGERAEVSVMRVGDEIRVRVSDDGPGMSAEALMAAENPFYRGDASRNRSTGGAGLGLTLASAIAKAHGGRLTLENRAPHGLEATIILPAVMKPSN
ncbi:MAG: HAMP domain-containing sensor histidine kinase [Hyphomonadaceae bacterium]